MDDRVSVVGALALELTPGSRARTAALEQAAAGELAALMARDLARFSPRIVELDLGVAAGLFDPVELLRPGYPLHGELARLVAQAPGRGDARVVAFGARAGQLPQPLRPEPQFADGPLRLIPWVLHGAADAIAAVGERLESVLLDAGMAGADTALLAQAAFGATVEHARYLTVHDLAAMTALQYEHAGLAPLWPLIETALLRPTDLAWLDNVSEPLAVYRNSEVRMAMFDLDAWVQAGFAPASGDAAKMTRAFDRFRIRQQQFAAVLNAHGIAVVFDHCPPGSDPRTMLMA